LRPRLMGHTGSAGHWGARFREGRLEGHALMIYIFVKNKQGITLVYMIAKRGLPTENLELHRIKHIHISARYRPPRRHSMPP
jgi:hypothetical protein